MRLSVVLFSGAVFALASLPASAHAGFLWPVTTAEKANQSVEFIATFSDAFPQSEYPLTSENWIIRGPDGTIAGFEEIVEEDTLARLRASLNEPGTYQLSTGERLGRMGQAAYVEGQFQIVGRDGLDPNSLPEGTEVLTSQTATVADYYMQVGVGDLAFEPAKIGRLVILPQNNPAELDEGETLAINVLFDSTPLSNYRVTLFTPHTSREEEDAETQWRTDDQGRVVFEALSVGPHLVMVRHVALAPEGAETEARSYSSVLTFNVTE